MAPPDAMRHTCYAYIVMSPKPDKVIASLQRRDFIRLSATATLVATVGCAAANQLDLRRRSGTVSGAPIALSERRYFVLCSLIEAMYPAGQKQPAGLEIGVAQRIDRELHFLDAHTLSQVELALDVLEYGGIFAGHIGRFSHLKAPRRLDVLQNMFKHRWTSYRQVVTALTQLVKGMYYADRRSWAGIGYDGPFMPALVPESIAAYPDYDERGA